MSWFSKAVKKIAKNDPTAKAHVKALNKMGLSSSNTLRRVVDPLSVQQEAIQKGAPITARTIFDPGNELAPDPNVGIRAQRAAEAGYQQNFNDSANAPIPGGPSGAMPAPQTYTPFQAQGPYAQQAMKMAGLLGQTPAPMGTGYGVGMAAPQSIPYISAGQGSGGMGDTQLLRDRRAAMMNGLLSQYQQQTTLPTQGGMMMPGQQQGGLLGPTPVKGQFIPRGK